MTNVTLAHSYLRKASGRLDVLDLLHRKGAWSDVIREARFIPTEEYKEGDAREAIENTRFVMAVVEKAFEAGR